MYHFNQVHEGGRGARGGVEVGHGWSPGGGMNGVVSVKYILIYLLCVSSIVLCDP